MTRPWNGTSEARWSCPHRDRRQGGARRLRRRPTDLGRGRAGAGGHRAPARDRRAPGALHRGPEVAGAGPPHRGRDDPLPGAADRGRLPGRERLRRAARRPGVQDGARPGARERTGPVLAADHVPAREPAHGHRAQADDGGHGRAVLRQLRAGAAPDRARHRRHRGPGPRRPGARALPRPLRRALLPADPRLRGDHGQAGGGDPAPRQDPGRGRGGARAAPRDPRASAPAGPGSTSWSAATATTAGRRR